MPQNITALRSALPVLRESAIKAPAAETGNLVLPAVGYGVENKAVETVRRWKFEPGMPDGKPVPAAAVSPITFRLL